LGVELINNVKKAWWYEMVQIRRDVVGLDSAIISSPKVWEASGHLTEGFADPLTECKSCHMRFRADKIENQEVCPNCGGELMPARKFNLMMKTFIGPVEDSAAVAYLRGETTQPIYVDFKLVADSSRAKVPFGIAQIGKAFRNEITPGNYTFRTREFEQMEMQFFIKPGENEKWFAYWREQRMNWYIALGMKKENLSFYEQKKNELAHYARAANDIYYNFPFGSDEIEGIHDRGDWDLGNHTKHSGKDLSYFDEASHEKFIPNVIETSAGATRGTLAFLLDAYTEEEVEGEKRVVLKLHPKLAPIKVAILPLMKNKDQITQKALEVYDRLKVQFMCQYDEAGSIGKRYRRQDEIGTPLCVTIDFDTLENETVTVRDRDTMKQERIQISELADFVKEKIS
jgi:glycyl-tRNA synthetase